MQAAQQQDFQDRLTRINRGAPNTRKAVGKPVNSLRENIKYPGAILGAFLVGALAVFVARYARFHLNGGALTGENADLMMLVDGAMALVVGFGLTMLFRLEAKDYKKAQTAGVLAMVCTMHNAVHWAPAPFETVFAPEWVAAVTENTRPNSILFRGATFVLKEPKGELPTLELPSIITLNSLDG